ncbi:hypothetical protein D3C87_1673890 [compost metagenome]
MTNANSRNTVNSQRVAVRPIRTVRVRFPAVRSWSMSRRLLASSTAHAMSPTPTAPNHASCGSAKACTHVVPSVATRPKNTKTNSSPRP